MRFKNAEFRIYFAIWIVILLLGAYDIFDNFRFYGTDYFYTLSFYISILILVFMVLLFIGLVKGSTRLIVVAFGGIVTLEAVEYFPVFLNELRYLSHYGTFGYDSVEILFVVIYGIVYPATLLIYALTYIATSILFFFNRRERHLMVNITSGLGVAVLVSYLAITVLNFFIDRTSLDLLTIFFDMAFAVFFHIIYITLPRMMHNHNLY